jgi:hypothetical protein
VSFLLISHYASPTVEIALEIWCVLLVASRVLLVARYRASSGAQAVQEQLRATLTIVLDAHDVGGFEPTIAAAV